MKYCSQCGTAMEDDVAFCFMCGTKVPSVPKPMSAAPQRSLHPNAVAPIHRQPVSTSQRSVEAIPKKKKRKGLLIVLLLLCVLLVGGAVAGVLFWKWYQAPQQQLDRALEAGDHDQVIKLLRQEPVLWEDDRTAAALEDRVEELTEKFCSGDLSYEDYVQELTELKDMNPEVLGAQIDQATGEALVLKTYSDYYDEARSHMAAEDYAAALMAYRMVAGGPLYEQAQAGCTEAEDALRRQILEEAAALAGEGKYTQAVECLEQGLKLLPQDENLLHQQEDYRQTGEHLLREDTLRQAAQYVQQENYSAAFKALRDYQKETGEDSEISAALSQYEDTYATEMIGKAQAYAREHRFEEAFKVLDEAQKELPKDSRLTTAREEIEALQPVSLALLNPIDAYRWNPSEPRLEDCLGNEFYDSINAFVPDHEGYALYQIDGAYHRITGQVSSLWIQKRESFFMIYADSELLYYSKGITPQTDPFTFDVRIPEGTKQIKLMVMSDRFDNSSILLTDVCLWP